MVCDTFQPRLPSTTFRLFNPYRLTESERPMDMSGCSVCILLSGVLSTNFASSYLCISALKSGKGSSAFTPVSPHRSQVMVLLYGL
ncbi:hypothetical protein T07_6186 [Trichinella nelsoni]|uniref:Uncharacterized protein n=1 Tax=Trichinella nelsoni TaxID=6336 RepID=A0A0V0RD74_9BILA|nr:hypothetical protein T07_6186 [Trichinella nelsoni]